MKEVCMQRRRKWLGFWLLVAILLIAGTAQAQIPQKLNYQGRVTHISAGVPLPGPHTMTFKIYASATGGIPLWSETQSVVADVEGVVSTILGSVNPIAIPFDGPYWLQVEVDGELLTPRREMVSAAYALNSADSEKLGGLEPTDFAAADHRHHSLDARDGSPTDVVDVDDDGNVTVTLDGTLPDEGFSVYREGEPHPLVKIFDFAGMGGGLVCFNDNGDPNIAMDPDPSGTGGIFLVTRFSDQPGFFVDGNFESTGEPRVSIIGSSQAAEFKMDESGDQSVELPVNSISSSEVLDEPGVASEQYNFIPPGLYLVNGINILASRTLVVPSAGYVLVMGTAQPTVEHDNSKTPQAEFGVSDMPDALPGNQDCLLMLNAGLPAGNYAFPVSVHGLFAVPSAGSYTFHFLANLERGVFVVNDVQLTIMFVPTSYGPVNPTFAGDPPVEMGDEVLGASSIGVVDLVGEARESEQVYRERVEQEFARMHQRLEALEREIQEQRP
jgi:hypothetical protein